MDFGNSGLPPVTSIDDLTLDHLDWLFEQMRNPTCLECGRRLVQVAVPVKLGRYVVHDYVMRCENDLCITRREKYDRGPGE